MDTAEDTQTTETPSEEATRAPDAAPPVPTSAPPAPPAEPLGLVASLPDPPRSEQPTPIGESTQSNERATNVDSIPSVPAELESQTEPATLSTDDEQPHRHFHFFPIPRSQEGARSDGDSNGTILITVNYVFSDNNNPQNPNRLGSLVMTFPDNASNRQPRIMQELVRYATLMAYRTIVSGLHKKMGTTTEKFKSFPVKKLHEVEGTTCSVCFDEYERSQNDECEDHAERYCKRRRLNSPDPLSGDEVNYQASPTIEAPLLPQSPLPPADAGNNASSPPKYLSEENVDYKHVPVELPCGHVFGRSCLYEWLKANTTCPLCRQKVEDEAPSSVNSPANTPNTGTTPIVFLNGGRAFNSTLDALLPGQDTNTNDNHESGVLSNILSYLRGPRETLFPHGVSSRRTESGVETTNDVVDYMNLRDLTLRQEQDNDDQEEQPGE